MISRELALVQELVGGGNVLNKAMSLQQCPSSIADTRRRNIQYLFLLEQAQLVT